ncbi:hypothetical protein GBSOP10_102127 [Armatimonadetes bacterium GBS]|jgi:hypothetical protein|nr:hypothetical protein GBSOP10_102127 [Armatimonadetes bacterium GBS]CUU38553.1 hypothetical protein GXSOP10_1401 [Armatimonadetes bacterium GXS]
MEAGVIGSKFLETDEGVAWCIECCSGNSDKRRFVCEEQVSNGSAVGAPRNFLEGYGKIWTDCLEP